LYTQKLYITRLYIVSPNDRYEDRFEEAQQEAQAARRGTWTISASEQAQLTDRDDGVGEDGCEQKATPSPSPLPPPPTPKLGPTPQEPNLPSVPPPQQPSRQIGADCSTGASNVSVVLGSKGDRDGDGIAYEK
jgi:hypothetical protein